MKFPDVYFGRVSENPVDWRKKKDESADDDEMIETPPDVVGILGFDPAKDE